MHTVRVVCDSGVSRRKIVPVDEFNLMIGAKYLAEHQLLWWP